MASAAVAGVVSCSAMAQSTVDGQLDPIYSVTPDAIQNTNTMFGDNDDPDVLSANGSEIDVIHVQTTATDLYIFIGGNLQSNFNKLELFIDAVDGGQNVVRFDNPDVDFDALNRMGGNAFVGGAFGFDEGFAADFYVSTGLGGDPITVYASAAQMLTDGGGVGLFLGSSVDNSNGVGGILSDTGIEVAINNSNVDGVISGEDSGDGSGVTTGIEFKIPFSAFPDVYTQGSGLKICAFINSDNHGFVSNQFISGLSGSDNLGEVRLVDLSLIPGCQFVVADGDAGGYPCNPGEENDQPADPAVAMDGSKDGSYGDAVGVQDTMTNFGDASIGLVDYCDGSEIDAMYGFIDDERLNILVAGNLESSFNHLDLFIDYGPGGQNTIRGDNPGVNFGALQRMGSDGKAPGLTFDTEFEADIFLEVNCGGEEEFRFYASAAQMLTDGGGTGLELGGALAGEVLTNFNGMQVALNNSNVAGVVGGTDLDDGSGVETGIEISIPLDRFVGYESGDEIKVCAFINSSDHGYVSNQVMGGLGGGDNLMESRFVDFSAIPGDQFVIIAGNGGTICVADLDGDGSVSGSDLTILLGNWGSPGEGDLDGSGSVGGADLTILLGAWGICD